MFETLRENTIDFAPENFHSFTRLNMRERPKRRGETGGAKIPRRAGNRIAGSAGIVGLRCWNCWFVAGLLLVCVAELGKTLDDAKPLGKPAGDCSASAAAANIVRIVPADKPPP